MLAITQANGLTTTQVRNSAGQLVSSTQSASGATSRTTTYLYNGAGEQVATIDPAGNVSYTFYDADGRAAGTVDALGDVTAYIYDADGHVSSTTQYVNTISTAGWVSGGALTASLPTTLPLPSPTANDRTTHTLYNAAGQVVATIDAVGNVTTIAYDGAGNAISTTAYATALTTAQAGSLGSTSTPTTVLNDIAANVLVTPPTAPNRTTRTLYNADNQPIATIDAAGYVTTTTYDDAGRVVETTAYATGLTATQLTALEGSPTLATVLTDIVSNEQAQGITPPNLSDQTTHTYYDGAGRVVAQVDADGYLTTIAYNQSTNTTTTTRYATALASAQLIALTSNENVVALVSLLGSNTTNQQSSATYNADNQLVSATAIDGTVTTYTYNNVGQLLATTVTPTVGQGTARTTASEYDAFGEVTGTLDGVGAANLTTGMTPAQQAAVFAADGTTYVYNTLGQTVQMTDALGNSTYSFYDADGRLKYTVQGQPSGSTRNALGNVTAYTYNAFGQVTNTLQYASQLTLTSGSSSGTTLNPTTATLTQVAAAASALLVSVSDANDLTQYTYTLDGQVAGTTNGDNYQTVYAYDTFGDVSQKQQQLSSPGSALSAANSTITNYTYDVRGEQTGEADAVGYNVARSTSSTYDAFGRVTSTTDGNGNVVTYGYDNLGRQVSTSQTVQGSARTTQTTYDAFDRVVTQTDALGNLTSYHYNLATHAVTVTTPDGVTMTSAKDGFGDTVSVTDGGSNTTIYTYDADGQLLSTKDALGNISNNLYDADGDLIRTTDATGHIVVYTYNASGKVLTQTVDPTSLDPTGLNLTTTYAYDGEGRQLSVTDPTGVVTTYVYDADGNTLTQVQDAGTGASHLNLTTTSTYDGDGRTLTVTVGAGTAAARTTQYTYDNLERLTQQIVDPGTGHLNLTTSYTYDANDNLTSVTDPLLNITRNVYDQANEKVFSIDPTGAVTQSWYDADGRVTLTRGYATRLTASQLSGLGSTPALGAVNADVTGIATNTDSYQQNIYNANGQVVYTLNGTGLNPTQYTYNAAGQLTQTRQYASALSTSSISPTAAPAAITPYITASNNDIVATTAYNADGQAVYHIDGAGDVTQMTYDAAGRVTATRAYATTLLSALSSAPTVAQVAAVVTTNAADRITKTAYDNAGRAAYTINGAGAVTQTSYDADGRVTSVHAYATALTSTQVTNLGNTPTPAQIAAQVTSTISDQISYNVYSTVGELRYIINPMGYVSETRYDATGLVTETLAYANVVTVGSEASALQQGTGLSWLSGAVGGTTGTNADNTAEATLYLYDAAGRQRFSVQQNAGGTTGVATEQRYDADGNVVVHIAYGIPLTVSTSSALSAQWTTSSLTTALAGTTAANKQVTNIVYDADSRAIYTINALNDVTQISYDAFGRVLETQQYASAITLPNPINATTIAAAVTAVGGATGERFSTTTYNSRGMVTSTGDALGVNASYTFNALGQKTSYTDRDGAVWNYSYDTAGRLVLQQSPSVTVGSYSGSTLQQTANQYLYTSTTYDTFGDVASVSQGSGTTASGITNLSTTAYGYDAVGHQTSIGYAGGLAATHVTYNALGQAVVSEDANGNYQYNVYNGCGQLAYAVDGNGSITATSYDAYGNVTTVTRYATLLKTSAITGWSAGQPLTLAQLQLGLVPSSTSSDRTTTTTYNQLNQKTQVLQPSTAYDLSMGALGGSVDTWSPTTTYTYDAYGNVTSTAQLVQRALTVGSTTTPAIWETTYNYYDALNRVLTVVTPTGSYTSPQGYVTATTYNAFGNVNSTEQYAQAISTAGISVSTAPAAPTAPTTAATGGNRSTSYSYDAIGRVHVQTVTGVVNYTGVGQLGTAGYALANSVTTYTYNGENQVASVNINGAITSTTYDNVGRVSTVTGPANLVLANGWQSFLDGSTNNDLTDTTNTQLYVTVSPITTYVYDALGHTLSTTNSGGGLSQQTLATYNSLGQQATLTDADGNVTTNQYDHNGNLLTQSYTLTGNGAPVTVTTTNTYDADNQQLSNAVHRSGQPASTYDSYTQVQYDAFGDVVKKGDNNGYEAIYTYYNTGLLATAPDSKTGAIHTYGYDLVGNLVVDKSTLTTGSSSAWTHFSYNNLANQIVSVVTPATNAATGESATPIQYAYDRWGNITSSTDANGNVTTYEYDGQNHLIEQTEASVLVVSASGVYTWTTPTKQWFYNVDGELMQTIDENGNTSYNVYDAAGYLTMTQDATGAQTTTAYDALGRAVAQQTPPVAGVLGPLSNITYTTYNNLNQVTAQGYFLIAGGGRTQAAEESYLLNSNGDRIQVTDALGNTSYYGYDSQHRVIESQTPLQYLSGASATFTYDANGNQTGETTADGDSESWKYDYFGRVQTHVDLSGATTTYNYDINSGLLTSEVSNWSPTSGQTDPQSPPGYIPTSMNASTDAINYTYNADGQVEQRTETIGGTAIASDTYQYDANGNTTSDTTWTSDGAGQVVDTTTTTTYDSHNRISVVTTTNVTSGAIESREAYNYDYAGNRRAVFAQSAYGSSSTPITATGAPPTAAGVAAQTVPPGTPWNWSAASDFTDNLGFGLSYSAAQSNGNQLPSWMTLNTNGTFSGNPTTAGSWTITVTAFDASGQHVSSTFTVTVPTVNPVFSAPQGNISVGVGSLLNFTVPAATDPNGIAIADYGADSWNGTTWGSLPSWLSFNTSTGTFTGTPPTGSNGTYTLGVIAQAANGNTVSESFTLTVSATSSPPVYNGGLGTTIEFDAGEAGSWGFSASDFTNPSGRAMTFTMTGQPAQLAFNPSTLTLSGTPINVSETKNYTVVVTATDPVDGLSTSESLLLTVNGNSGSDVVTGGPPVQVQTAQTQTTTAPNIQAYWFTYDNDNRTQVNDGALVNGQIVLNTASYENSSYTNEYDAAGNVDELITDNGGVDMYQSMYYDQRNELVQTNYAVYAGQASLGQQQTQTYDLDGHLKNTVTYFTNISSQPVFGTIDVPDGTVYLSTASWSDTAETNTYNADGVLTNQTSLVGVNDWKQIENNLEQGGTLSPNVTTIARLTVVASSTTNTTFDEADNVTAYTLTGPTFGATYQVNYLKKDGYLQESTTGTATVSGYVPSTDTLYYNAFGQNIALSQTSDNGSGTAQNGTRAFAYDTEGQILQERGGSVSGNSFIAAGGNQSNSYTYVNGQQAGDMDQAGDIGVLGTLTGFTTNTQNYVVQSGDTLASIAQTVYGNSGLAYIIGEANGMNSASTLAVGQSIVLPTVTTDTNTATTFKPYNPSGIIGSTTPTLELASAFVEALSEAMTFVATGQLTAGSDDGSGEGIGSNAGAVSDRVMARMSSMERPAYAAQAMIGVGQEDMGGGPPSESVSGDVDAGDLAEMDGEGPTSDDADLSSFQATVSGLLNQDSNAAQGAGSTTAGDGSGSSLMVGSPNGIGGWPGYGVSGGGPSGDFDTGQVTGVSDSSDFADFGDIGTVDFNDFSGFGDTGDTGTAGTNIGDPSIDIMANGGGYTELSDGGDSSFNFANAGTGVGGSASNPNVAPVSVPTYDPNNVLAQYNGAGYASYLAGGYSGTETGSAGGDDLSPIPVDTTLPSIEFTPPAVEVGDIPVSIASVGSVQLSSFGDSNVTSVPGTSSEDDTGTGQDQGPMEWKVPGYTPSPSTTTANASTLPVVTVNSDGTSSVATNYTPAEEAQFQQNWSEAIDSEQTQRDSTLVAAANAKAERANQQQLAMLHNLYQKTGKEAAEVFVAPAILASAVAAAPLTLAAAGTDALFGGGALLTTGQVAGGAVGWLAGYHTDGWQGGVLGASAGILSFGGSSFLAGLATEYVGYGTLGTVAGGLTFATSNGLAGSLAVAATNAATGNPVLSGTGTAFVLSATSPFLSGEVGVAAIGGDAVVGKGIADAFSIYTDVINLAESYLPHPSPSPSATPNVSEAEHK